MNRPGIPGEKVDEQLHSTTLPHHTAMRLDLLLAKLPVAAYACDAEGLMTYFNEHAVRLWGRVPMLNDPDERFCGSCRLFALDGSAIPHDQCVMAQALRTGQEQHGELRMQRADGRLMTVQASANPIFDESGRLLGASNVIVEITRRTEMEQALRVSEERFRSLVESISEGIAVVDADGLIRYASPSLEYVLGYTPDELQGSSSLALAHPDDLAEARQILQRAVEQPGVRVRFQTRVRHADGTWRWLEGICTSHLKTPAVRGVVVNFRDVTERRQTQDSLAADATRLELALAAARMGVWEWDPVNDIIYWSPECHRIIGRKRVPASQDEFADFVHADDLQVTSEMFEAAMADRSDYQNKLRVWTDDGECRWISDRARGIYDATGRLIRVVGTVQDITDRVRAEEALRESRRFLHSIADASPHFIYIFDFDLMGITYQNRSLFSDLGYSADIGAAAAKLDTFRNYLAPGEEAHLQRLVEEWGNLSEGQVRDDEYHLRDAAGWTRSFSGRELVFAHRPDGSIRQILGTLTDITEQRRSQQKLQLFRSLIDHIDDAIEVVDAITGRFLDVNEGACRALGYTRDEYLNLTVEDVDPLVQAWKWNNIRQNVMHTGSIVLESTHQRKDGSTFPVEVNCTHIRLEQDYFLAVVRDISDRKRDEQALRDSEERFRTMADNAPVMIWVTQPNGDCTFLNETWYRFTGQTPETALGFGWAQALHPLDRQDAVESFLAANSQRERFALEHRVRRADGEYRWVIDSAAPRFSEEGEFLGYIGSVIDITERKQAEQRVLDSERLLRLVMDVVPHYIFAKNRDGRFLFVNQFTAERNGFGSPEDMVGAYERDLAFDQDELSNFARDDILVIESRRPLFIPEETVTDPTGSVHVTQTSKIPFTFPGTSEPAVLGIAVDITDRVRIERELRDSRERLALALEAANIGPWEWDVRDNTSVFSPEWKRQLGYEPDEIEGSFHEWKSRIHPDDHERVQSFVQDYFDGRVPQYTLEFRLRHKDGTYRWIHSQGVLQRDAQGHPTRMIGCHVDITERKQAEETIRHILEAIAPATGQAYFTALVNYLCQVCQVKFAAVVELDKRDSNMARTIAISREGLLAENFAYDLRNTPCEQVRQSSLCHFPTNVQREFPQDAILARMGIDGYMGIPLRSSDAAAIGLIVLMHDRPIPDPEHARTILQVVGARSGAELERQRAETALRESEDRLLAVIRNAPKVAIQWYDADGRVVLWNDASEEIFGFSSAEALGRTLDQLIHTPEETEQFRQALAGIARTGESIGPTEYIFRRRNGTQGVCLSSIFRIPGDGQVDWFVCMDVDITDRKRAEEERQKLESQIRHAQKLESLGVLAGGIAHDFNNLLTVILGYSDLARTTVAPESSTYPFIEEIVKGARNAAELTRQLLAYSGKGRFVIQPLDLSALVSDMSRLLELSISKNCLLQYHLAADLPSCEADAAQLQQVVMNLVINASESIGEGGGVIRVTTCLIHGDRDCLALAYLDDGLPEGSYVCLEVADTGCGMSEETKAKIFDPFFTTKFTGRGLGLAAVLGIVRGHRGAIKVFSEPNRGTTFKVLFPASDHPATLTKAGGSHREDWRGTGTALIVDDEESVRGLARHMLERMGFEVVTASGGREGVEIFRMRPESFQFVLLDMTMPHWDGEETFRELRRIDGGVRAILMSGYSEQTATSRFTGTGLAGFIQKPFRFEDLLELVRKVVENRSSSVAEGSA